MGAARQWRSYARVWTLPTGRWFRAATDSLDEYTDTVTSYIRFCEALLLCGGWLKLLTNYRPRAPRAADDRKLADQLNSHYARFQTSHPSPNPITTVATSARPNPDPHSSHTAPSVLQQDVRKQFRRQNTRSRRCLPRHPETLCR